MADDFKYHIDHHVTLLPPPELTEARAAHARGDLDAAGLRAAEDTAIREALRLQRRLGLSALGDGQFRRRNELSVVYDTVDGFGDPDDKSAIAELLGPHLAPERRPLNGLPAASGRLAKHEADFLTSTGFDRPLVLALPAPGFVLALSAEADPQAETDAEAGEALAGIIRDEIAALAAEGIVHVQLHNPLLSVLLTVGGRERATALGLDPTALLDRVLAADNAVLTGLATPETFRVTLDLTTGGQLDIRRGYDPAAVDAFLAQQNFGRLSVEYPADESAQFPIDRVPEGLVLAIGIIDVSTPDTEAVDDLLDRVDKVTAVKDIDDVAISTNGGFAGTNLTPEDQHTKLQLVETVARYYWGNEL